MRVSEKTLELNFASQMNFHFGGKLVWFGLTQLQEAKAGFDIATQIGAGLFIVQMKASNTILKSGTRQFRAPHTQLQNLLKAKLTPAAVPIPGQSVFYAFPTIGSLAELTAYPDVFVNTWLCDVMGLGALGPPTLAAPPGVPPALRNDGCHYVDVSPGKPPIVLSPATGAVSGVPSVAPVGTATFHSVPLEVDVLSGTQAFFASSQPRGSNNREISPGLLQVMTNRENFDDFWRLCESFERKAFGIVITK
jgi:hypothetical protein